MKFYYVCRHSRIIEDVLRSKRLYKTNSFWKNYTSARNSHNCPHKKRMGTEKPLIYLQQNVMGGGCSEASGRAGVGLVHN